jgi:branched-chain amino acid transport system permease protein
LRDGFAKWCVSPFESVRQASITLPEKAAVTVISWRRVYVVARKQTARHMGVSESYARGRELVDSNPLGFALGLFVLLLFLDLLRQLFLGGLTFQRLGITLLEGLMQGLVIGLAGIGLSMTYSILNFANFAHGDYITSGAFVGYATTYIVAGGFGTGEWDIGSLFLLRKGVGTTLNIGIMTTPAAVIVGLIFAGLSTVGLALLVDRLAFKPIRDRGGIALLITSIGVALTLRYLIRFVWGPAKRGPTVSQPEFALPVPTGSIGIGAHEATIFVASITLMLGVHFLLQTTKLGKAMRAMSDNEDLARVTGIPTERVVRYTWIIGGGLTGAAGFLFVLWRGTFGYFDGWLLLLLIFAAVILGGIGSIYGAILGGLIIGLTASVSVVWIPSDFARAAAFFVMIVILVIKPQGLFAGRTTA